MNPEVLFLHVTSAPSAVLRTGFMVSNCFFQHHEDRFRVFGKSVRLGKATLLVSPVSLRTRDNEIHKDSRSVKIFKNLDGLYL